ncbi:MAG: metal-dependent hydrolase [Acidobacteria bacterium]|nr:metal-dependent hydrolase [Acidobacteriota bacterium]
MDNLTHTLTGLLVARAAFSRLPRASLICILAANAPDLDVVTALAGSHVYLDHHRGFTHGFLAAPAIALLCAAVGRFATKLSPPQPFPWLLAFLAALAASLSHLALDWTNIYGIRLLAPFSQQWFRADLASVFDPLLFAILLAFTLWPLLGRLVNQEIGAHTRYGVGSARTALLLAFLYFAARGILHERALASMNARLYDGQEALRTAAFPHIVNPFRWRGLVDLPTTYRILPVNLLAEYDPDAGRVLYKGAERNPAAQAAAATEPFQSLTRFAPYLFWQTGADVVPEEVFTVEATDLRFALPGEGRFTAHARLNAYRKILSSEFRFTPPGELPQPR